MAEVPYTDPYYCEWTLTKDYTTYEHSYRYVSVAGTGGVISTRKTYVRQVDVRTWEATVSDSSETIPKNVNPGGLSAPWKIEQDTYDRERSVPLSKRVSETWTRRGAWTLESTEVVG